MAAVDPQPRKNSKPIGNQYFPLPLKPDPKDHQPRNGFGYLIGFGKAMKEFYENRDKEMGREHHHSE